MAEALDYSEDEWKLLITVPQTVAGAVMVAHSGGLMRETLAMLEAFDLARQQFSGSRLVETVLDGVQRGDTTVEEGSPHDPPNAPPHSMEEDALAESRQAAELLRRAPEDEAEAYRQFVHFLANHVAGAAKEGGFFGIGGKRFSTEEMNIIAAVDAALGA
jgi:hypothetical protein